MSVLRRQALWELRPTCWVTSVAAALRCEGLRQVQVLVLVLLALVSPERPRLLSLGQSSSDRIRPVLWDSWQILWTRPMTGSVPAGPTPEELLVPVPVLVFPKMSLACPEATLPGRFKPSRTF